MLNIKDPLGEQLLLEYRKWFNSEFANQRKAGISANELTDPASRHYLGKAIPKFTRSMREIMRARARSLSIQEPPKAVIDKPTKPINKRALEALGEILDAKVGNE